MATRSGSMSFLLLGELVRVALRAVWSNKLRSSLTILGNIVAVASIMTLVSLIEGINDEVTQVIVTEVGADSFLIDRLGLITSEDVFFLGTKCHWPGCPRASSRSCSVATAPR